MIDEKKIEEAKKAFISDKTILGVIAINDLACGFKAGAKWAINEFLEDLWHPAREEPKIPNGETYVACLVKYKNKSTELCIYWLTDGWSCNTMCHRVFMENFDSWLYINDLLKK